MKMYDISLPLASGMVGYPGDPPFERTLVGAMSAGASSDVSRLALSAHSGTHVDAPSHMIPGAATVDQLPLEIFTGPAVVLEVRTARAIEPADLAPLDRSPAERILFKTRNSTLWAERRPFQEDFVYLTGDSAADLVRRGVRLVAVDYLSVDRFHSGTHPAHIPLLRAGVVIIEGVDLSAVPPGPYTLVCAPLRIAGGEAAPARVFLLAP